MIPVIVNNNTYRSIAAAWREVSPPGLPLVTVRARLKEEWEPLMAFMMPQVPPELRCKFKGVRNI